MAVYKARGGKLGTPANLTAEAKARGQRLGTLAVKSRADEAYADLVPWLRELKTGGASLRQMAGILNGAGHATRTGAAWNRNQVKRGRPANTLKALFPEAQAKPAGPPPLPTAMPGQSSSQPFAVELDDPEAIATPTTAETAGPPPPRKPDFFDKARALAQKAQAKAEAFQRDCTFRENVYVMPPG